MVYYRIHMHGYLFVYVCLCVLYLRDFKKGPLGEMFIVLKSDVFLKCICMDKLGVYLLWRRQWHSTPVLLPGKSHGWRSLVGCSPWGCKESDTTEQLHFHFSLQCVGEGNGNPLQCSCLENPRDRGAWLAAVYGVAQSRT